MDPSTRANLTQCASLTVRVRCRELAVSSAFRARLICVNRITDRRHLHTKLLKIASVFTPHREQTSYVHAMWCTYGGSNYHIPIYSGLY